MAILTRAAVLGAGAALAAVVLLALAGYRPVVIRSGSMTPALHVGDLVLSRSAGPAALRPGDVVTFHDPDFGGRSVTHRVVRVTRADGGWTVMTRGDANAVGETWGVAAGDRVGLATGTVPYLGWFFLLLHTGPARVALVLLAGGWVAAESLTRVRGRV